MRRLHEVAKDIEAAGEERAGHTKHFEILRERRRVEGEERRRELIREHVRLVGPTPNHPLTLTRNPPAGGRWVRSSTDHHKTMTDHHPTESQPSATNSRHMTQQRKR
jgi:hypothetical protein